MPFKVLRRPAATIPPVLAFAVASFSTMIDMFGPMAMGPMLAASYETAPGRIGVILNASTAGMALAGVSTALLANRLGRKPVMVGALLLLAVPTACLALAPTLGIFALLRVLQGALMSVAFSVAIAFAAETGGPGWAPVLMASYVTGNVASNMLGRVLVGLLAGAFGWRVGFLALACLNVLGGLTLTCLLPASPERNRRGTTGTGQLHLLGRHLSDGRLLATYAIGFLLMFSFVGIFTYVNFRLASPPLSLSSARIGLLYFVFAPSLLTTLQAGRFVSLIGHRFALLIGCFCSLAGILLTADPSLMAMLTGLAVFGAGTFFCHAIASAFAGMAAADGKLASGGLYLTFYAVGGLCGAIVMGTTFAAWGWGGCVTVAAGAFCLVAGIAVHAWPHRSGATAQLPG